MLFWAALSMRRMHNVRFAEFYMWDFPLLPHIRHASWKVTLELVFVTQFQRQLWRLGHMNNPQRRLATKH